MNGTNETMLLSTARISDEMTNAFFVKANSHILDILDFCFSSVFTFVFMYKLHLPYRLAKTNRVYFIKLKNVCQAFLKKS